MKIISTSTLTIVCLLTFAVDGIAQNKPLQMSFGGLRARSIGPAAMSGRVADIDGVNSKPEIIYVGSASGGVWKSVNAGSTFRPIFDEQTMSIGKVTIDQSHPDTVWVGTGESWVRNSVSVGTGVYLSKNGGNTWEFKGLGDSEHIADIVIDPSNSNTVYVAAQGHLWDGNTERGVFKSTDFGTTWQKILYIDENTGCADLAIDPKNPNTIYAAMWEHRRSPDFFNSGGKSSGLYKSTDGGKNWKKIALPTGDAIVGRMAIAYAPSNSNFMYLTIEAEKKADKGLYKSEDNGKTWTKMNSEFNLTVRPFYFSRLTVDPNNEKKIYKAGLSMSISEDGGNSFRQVGGGVHSDMHCVWINPKNTNAVFIGTDGGAYRSLDGGQTFEMFMDLPLSQFYHVSVDNDEPYNVYGGLQDNNSWFAPSSSPGGIQNSDWKTTSGGDGFWSFRHPTDKNIVYSESQGGELVRYNKKDGQSKLIRPIATLGEPEFRFNWNAPVHLSPNNPERMYFASQYLFVTENRGDTWTRISPDLTTNDPQRQRQKKSGGLSIDNSTAENNTTIYSISESPKDGKIIWAGTDDGNLQVSIDGGKSWKNVAPNIAGLPKLTWCSFVEASHFDKNTAYVTFDGHNTGDKKTYIFKTTNLGKTWTSLVTPEVEGYVHTIVEDLKSPNLLFVGTELGLFISLDGGTSWKKFTNNFPSKVAVRSLVIHPTESALVIGTHGRGVYIMDDIAPLRQVNAEFAEQKFAFFPPKTAVVRLGRGGEGGATGAGQFVGDNPDEAASIAYYMKSRHTFGKMTLEVLDAKGKLVKELPAGKSAGINVVALPTRLPMTKPAPSNNRQAVFGGIFGTPPLEDGVYTVKVKKGAEEFSQNVTLTFDPKANINYPAAERKAQRDVQIRLYNMTNNLGWMYYAMKDMFTQADKIAAKAPKATTDKLKAFSEDVKKYQNTLVALDGDFYIDESEALREKISKLYLYVANYPGKPSDGQISQTAELEAEMAKVKVKFDAYSDQVKTLNALSEPETIKVKTLEEYLKD